MHEFETLRKELDDIVAALACVKPIEEQTIEELEESIATLRELRNRARTVVKSLGKAFKKPAL